MHVLDMPPTREDGYGAEYGFAYCTPCPRRLKYATVPLLFMKEHSVDLSLRNLMSLGASRGMPPSAVPLGVVCSINADRDGIFEAARKYLTDLDAESVIDWVQCLLKHPSAFSKKQ
jgi:cobalamin biosynthesis protein CbiG